MNIDLPSKTVSNQGEENDTGISGSAGSASSIVSKNKNLSKYKKLVLAKRLDFAKANSSETDFLIFKAKKTFIHLWKLFTKLSILYHFDPKSYIWIETDASGFVIYKVLS